MSEIDGDGTLPPSRHDEQGSLPAGASSNVAQPIAASSTVEKGDRIEIKAKPSVRALTLQERLMAVTNAGGLFALPSEFGDPDSDWSTVRAENPFTVLYLDGRCADAISPDMVIRHRDLLRRFWQEKLRSMSQGAARIAILKKYGGEEESERLVRSYPDRIERAYEKLATQAGIAEAARSLALEREARLLAIVDQKIGDFLIDEILQPAEIAAVFELGDHEGIARPTVARRIQDRLQERGFVAATTPAGATLEAKLLSTAWSHPAAAPQQVPRPVEPPKRSLLVPLLLFSLVVVVVLLVSSALNVSTIETTTHVVPTTITVTVAEPQSPPPSPPPVRQAEIVAEPTPIPIETSAPEPPPGPSQEERERAAAAEVIAQERRRIRDELDAIRHEGEGNAAGALERIDELARSIGNDSPEYAAERLDLATLRAELEKTVLTERLRAEADERRQREWEQRLAQVETLSKQGNYSGAKTLADQLISEPDVPAPVSERAKQLADDAVAQLQQIFSKAKVSSKTGRAPRARKP